MLSAEITLGNRGGGCVTPREIWVALKCHHMDNPPKLGGWEEEICRLEARVLLARWLFGVSLTLCGQGMLQPWVDTQVWGADVAEMRFCILEQTA